MTRLAAAATVVVCVFVAGVLPALAQVGYGDQDGSGISAGAGGPGSTPPRADPVSTKPRGGDGPRPTCTAADGVVGPVNYRPVPPHLLNQYEKDKIAQEGGSFVVQFCGDELAPKLSGLGLDTQYRPPGAPGGPPAVDPAQLAAEALERTPLPEPQITMAPAPHIPQLVNLTTYLWVPATQWRPATASASAGGVTSTVTATPTRVIWDMGQGDQVICDGPGVPYRFDLPDEQQPSDCHYTYRRSSAGQPGNTYTVTATVEWETTWSVTGAPGGGSLGTVRRSASTPVQVAELQVVNVYPEMP